MSKGKNNKAKIQTFLGRDDVFVTANIEENCILTTEDKIKILYNEYNEARKYSGEIWTFLGLFVALITTLLTCEFKSIGGISEAVVEAAYILATVVAFALTIVALIQWLRHRKKLSFSYFIGQIKGTSLDK